MISGIIFDMDGVIFDTEKFYQKYWIKSAKEFGFEMKPETVLTIRSLTSVLAEKYLKSVFGETFDYFSIRNRRRELMTYDLDEENLPLKTGILSLLKFCNENNIKTAVSTATMQSVAERYLKNSNLIDYFDVVIGGDSIEKGKPFPDIYILASKALNLPPESCIAIEDSPNGILSAFYAGCNPVMVPDLSQPDEMLKPFLKAVVPTLEDVISLIKKYND
ncbi:MAG: HAD family phosphatase [Ruminococcus sp.]|nr:HAD family phosphatase [Ruminococcus sp.]